MRSLFLACCLLGPVFSSIENEIVAYEDIKDQRFNSFQFLAAQDCYHKRRSDGRWIHESHYEPGTLQQQLEEGVRAFHFDVYRDELAPLDFRVYHIVTYDEETQCETMDECMAQIYNWTLANYGGAYQGEPIFIGIEPQFYALWTSDNYLNLDTHIENVLSLDHIFTPADYGAIYGEGINETWPEDWDHVTLEDLWGDKFLIHVNGRNLPDYFESGELTAAALNYFYICKSKDTYEYCAMHVSNDPVKKFDDIAVLSQHRIVKTKADTDFVQIAGLVFDPDAYTVYDESDMSTTPINTWASRLVFYCADLDMNEVLTKEEALIFAGTWTEGDEDAIAYVNATITGDITLTTNFDQLELVVFEMWGVLDVNRTYIEEKQNRYALESGAQMLQTNYPVPDETNYGTDPYYFHLNCPLGEYNSRDGLELVLPAAIRWYNETSGTWHCIQVLESLTTTTPMAPTDPIPGTTDEDDGDSSSRVTVAFALLFALFALAQV